MDCEYSCAYMGTCIIISPPSDFTYGQKLYKAYKDQDCTHTGVATAVICVFSLFFI